MTNILKRWLNKNKIKQAQFAREIKVCRSLINLIVHDRATPSLKTALKIEQATNGEVSVQKLAKGE